MTSPRFCQMELCRDFAEELAPSAWMVEHAQRRALRDSHIPKDKVLREPFWSFTENMNLFSEDSQQWLPKWRGACSPKLPSNPWQMSARTRGSLQRRCPSMLPSSWCIADISELGQQNSLRSDPGPKSVWRRRKYFAPNWSLRTPS